MTAVQEVLTLDEAFENSYYFIAGCGGDLQDWITGYENMMTLEGIGKPVKWLRATGAQVNAFAGPDLRKTSYFKKNLVCLLFPLEGLNVGKLALFRIQMEDRWFDDVIQNMRRAD